MGMPASLPLALPLQVFVGGKWGTVCPVSSGFSTYAARMVCTKLGYIGGAVSNTAYGRTTLPILVSNVLCAGKETELSACQFSTVTTGCTHAQDVGIRCTRTRTCRLAGWLASADAPERMPGVMGGQTTPHCRLY